ncbi:MAG: DUF5110 domain-containing protein [Bacteroidales bacterium]|jgi:alpha-D-xyloside xylohydrolase|nr:DUF5110 domain-containing protein [Bacteroidales bacterium]
MKKKVLLSVHKICSVALLTGLVACCTPRVKINEDGVTIYPVSSQAKAVRLQAVTDHIIRVEASPVKNFSTRKSLIASYPTASQAGWTVTQSAEEVCLKTSAVTVAVSLQTGEMTFSGKDDAILLKEAAGGKSFLPAHTDGEQAWTVRQVFESPDGEAFYGLGQHQSDEFNYKGKSEVLYQYNTKVSVPFIVSSKNYGLLWDNYSLTKFGNPREYQPLSSLNPAGSDGQKGGLTAIYSNPSVNTSPTKVVRNENAIDYENLETVRNFPENFRLENAHVQWSGSLAPDTSGVYHFKLYYAGYVKVFVNDTIVVDERWRTAWNPNTCKFDIRMRQGVKTDIRIEWRPDGGMSYIGLKALRALPEEAQQQSWWSETADGIDYYFIHGDNPDEIISGYRTVTGKAQVMPKWAMGFWQSRERYKTQEELLNVLKEFRQRHIPIDNIVQDWSYWEQDAWGSHDFDTARFPDATAMVDEVHHLNARIMISVWPKFYHTTAHYKAFNEKGWIYPLAVRDSIRDWIGKGYIGSFYDAFSEGARQLFWAQMNEKLYSRNFDAWWMDASEPDILSNADMAYRKALMNPTALGSSARYFNAYGLMNAKGIYEGQRNTNGVNRVFLLTRSGFAGSQRYAAAIWSGDIGTRWEDLKAQISAGLNFSISGNPYWTMDNGGFCVEKRYTRAKEGSEDLEEWRELNNRWHQFGAFAPLFRTHGQYPYRELWNIAPETHPAYRSMLYYTRLRYRLMPYIYTLAGWTYHRDYTIMRPLVMDFGNDTNVHNIGDQYMFGPALMVCPVYRYKARTRTVYLPNENGWYDVYSGKYIATNGWLTVDAPYHRIPLFVAAGSVLPVGAPVQHTQETQKDLYIYVYAGKNGTFHLYEDEGGSYHYEDGVFATIPFTYDDSVKTLTVGERTGDFPGMCRERDFYIVYVAKDKPVGIDALPTPQKVHYNGDKQTVKLR